ncbi:hypothetical protein [Trebonia kvetii]|uniref:hypothetical protein n=1 Tax=Trebonia kvetii TaxID=2480626 RepID=UPI001652B023|nr:hypothetical protein [Trebonia kvetii]
MLARVDAIEAARLVSGLDDAFSLVAGRFFRRKVRLRARACVAGMLSGLERKTGWSLAEHAGRSTRPGCSGCSPPPGGTRNWSVTT